MRTKRQDKAAAPPPKTPQVIEGEKTVIHVGPAEIRQKLPRQLHGRPLSLLDVIGFAVLASTALLAAFIALAYGFERLRDWLAA